MTDIRTLTHNQLVRLPSWKHYYAHIFVLVDSLCNDPETKREPALAQELLERARKRGDDEVSTIFTGAMLVNDPSYYEREKAKHESATVITDGEIVIVNGQKYTVTVVRGNGGKFPQNSDPIHFRPVV